MKHGWEGYGLFWAIVEKLRDSSNYTCVRDYNLIAYDLRCDAALIKSIIEDFGLFAFTEDSECIYSESLMKRMSIKDGISHKRSEAGKKSAILRGCKSKQSNNCSTIDEQTGNNCSTIKVKKSKVNEIKEENNSSNEELQKKDENPPSPPSRDPVNNPPQNDAQTAPPPTPSPDHIETEFNEFWKVYDKKTSRDICLKKWCKLSKADREAILRTVRAYVESTPDKKFRKNPETYLNKRAWEFEIIQAPATTMQVRPAGLPISKIRKTVNAVQEAQRLIRQESEHNT